MEIRDYLKENYFEATPEFLLNYKKGQAFPIEDFLNSRIVYYPGAGDRSSLS